MSRTLFCAGLVALLTRLGAAVVCPGDDAIRRKTREILARPEFKQGRGSDLWYFLLELLASVIGWLGSLRQTAPVLFYLLVIGLSLLLALLLWDIGRSIYRALAARPHPDAEDLLEERRGRLSLSYREQAQRKAADGEFTEAIRFLFLSLVYRFDESGRVSFQKACTNREYLALFADRPDLHAELQVFVDTLDENWYGQHPTEEQRYQNCLLLYQSLQ